MKPEVEAAADWWANALSRVQVQDNGDLFQSALATFAASTAKPLEENEREAFKRSLAERLDEHVSKGGFERRAVGVDYGPDVVLAEALVDAVGLDRARKLSLLWPIKTTMWIDPGKVAIRHGYGAPIRTIYEAVPNEVL